MAPAEDTDVTNNAAWQRLRDVLGDEGISDAAKLLFARLIAGESFRDGWGIGWWPVRPAEQEALAELEQAGHIWTRDGSAFLAARGD